MIFFLLLTSLSYNASLDLSLKTGFNKFQLILSDCHTVKSFGQDIRPLLLQLGDKIIATIYHRVTIEEGF